MPVANRVIFIFQIFSLIKNAQNLGFYPVFNITVPKNFIEIGHRDVILDFDHHGRDLDTHYVDGFDDIAITTLLVPVCSIGSFTFAGGRFPSGKG